jgi:hypothetical protein
MAKRATFRDTFGIDYADVITSTLSVETILTDDFDRGHIRWKNKDYILHCDSTVRKTLGLFGEAKVIISFQERTTGFYALARLYRDSI